MLYLKIVLNPIDQLKYFWASKNFELLLYICIELQINHTVLQLHF